MTGSKASDVLAVLRPPLVKTFAAMVEMSVTAVMILEIFEDTPTRLSLLLKMLLVMLLFLAVSVPLVRHVDDLLITAEGIRIRIAGPFRGFVRYDDVKTARVRGFWGLHNLHVSTSSGRKVIVPIAMGLPIFYETIVRYGGANSQLARACARLLERDPTLGA